MSRDAVCSGLGNHRKKTEGADNGVRERRGDKAGGARPSVPASGVASGQVAVFSGRRCYRHPPTENAKRPRPKIILAKFPELYRRWKIFPLCAVAAPAQPVDASAVPVRTHTPPAHTAWNLDNHARIYSMSGASPSRSDTVRLLLRDSDALGRLLSRAVIVGNVLSVGVLLVMYANFQLFRGYVTSALLGLIASIALHDTKQEWAFRLAGHLPASHHTRLQSRPPLSWRARVLLPALALLAVRSRPWFITLASATAAAAAAALFVWLSARAAVRAGAVDAHTAAALLIIAALLSAMCAAALVLSLGIVEDVVSAMRSLAYAVRAALRARQWDKSSAATKALEQVQAYLATHAEAAESLGRRAHAMAREVGLDMDNPNAWWVRGSDPAEWRRWAASASSGPLNLSSLMSLHSTDVRAGWRRFCAMLRQQSLSTAQLSLVWKRLRAAFPTERWLALARSSLGYASAAVRYVGVVASYIDGLGAFLAIVLVLLRQPTSVLTPLIRPSRAARRGMVYGMAGVDASVAGVDGVCGDRLGDGVFGGVRRGRIGGVAHRARSAGVVWRVRAAANAYAALRECHALVAGQRAVRSGGTAGHAGAKWSGGFAMATQVTVGKRDRGGAVGDVAAARRASVGGVAGMAGVWRRAGRAGGILRGVHRGHPRPLHPPG
eukprot:ctg_248.g137